MRHILLLILSATLLWSCSNASESTENPVAEVTEEQVEESSSSESNTVEQLSKKPSDKLEEGKLIISRAYATSTNFEGDFSVYNCFDNDTNSFWKTQHGAGPDEGLMIYFERPTYIDNVLIFDPKGKQIKGLTMYVDGNPGSTNWGLQKEVESIFIKASQSYYSDYQSRAYYKKSKDGFFGISEIEFYKSEKEVYDVVLPNVVKGNVSATSNLKPDVAYGAFNLVDGKRESGWAEDVSGNGIGEKITFSFDERITVDEIKIWNGYQRSVEHLSSNAALKEFTINGESKKAYKVNGAESIKLDNEVSSNTITLEVKSAYPGEKYEDLVISEIQFYYQGLPIVIQTDAEKKLVAQNLSYNNALLSKVLNQNFIISDNIKEEENGVIRNKYGTRSLLLRTNNTFVSYEKGGEYFVPVGASEEQAIEAEVGSDNIEIIADGNWEIKSISESEIKIRIFGKKFTPMQYTDLYKGEVTNETLKIFQDYITITPSQLKGQKVIGAFPIK